MRKFSSENRVAEAELGDLSSGEEKNFVFDLTLLPGPAFAPGIKHGIKVTWSFTNMITGDIETGEKSFDVELVHWDAWVEPARDEDIVAELKSIRLQDVRDRALALYQAGREQEADALLREAGEELQQFMDSSLYMSDRSRARMFSQSTEFANFATMSDMNEKQKRIRESRSRVNRDKGDFRDKP
jgi:hypothetical protein